jgi:hypothetical protein
MRTGCRSAARRGLIGQSSGEVRQGYPGSMIGNMLKRTGRGPESSGPDRDIPRR